MKVGLPQTGTWYYNQSLKDRHPIEFSYKYASYRFSNHPDPSQENQDL